MDIDEAAVIEKRGGPITVDDLVADFRTLGLNAGETVIVHTSLSSIGWVCVDAQTVVDALLEVLTPEGTLVMPTHSGQYSNPAHWSNPPIPEGWIETVTKSRPAYRPETTPTRGVGVVPECFRSYPGVHRSRHPSLSFAAWGANAETIIDDHAFDFGLGEDSPLARVYDLEGSILLLGIDHRSNTSLHLAEHRAALDLPETTNIAPVLEDGERKLVEYRDLETDDSDFATIGDAFETAAPESYTRGSVGAGTGRLVSQPALVDFAVDWLETNR